MAKQKQTRKRQPGERMSIFFEKGAARVRLRMWPVADGYRVSAVRKEKGKDPERSVEAFPTLADARIHVTKLSEASVKAGWKQAFGVRGNNAALFA
jgi:hypothetical protein